MSKPIIFTEEDLEIRKRIKTEDLERQAKFRASLLEHPRLTYLFFELTDRCNLACLHCGSNCSAQNATYIETPLMISTLQTVAEDFDPSQIMICLTGGEPLLHPDFEILVAEINRLGFTWGMTTNATLITPAVAKKLKNLKMGSLSISIDGLRNTHNWFRGAHGDNYQKTINAIKYLQKEKFSIQVTTVVHKKNLPELEELYREMTALKIDSWRVINIEPIGRALESQDLTLSNEEMIALFDFIREKRFAASTKGMDVCFGCSHYLSTDYERDLRNHCFMCGSGIMVASILCNGDIYSCLDIERRPELVQGNVKIDRFSDVWKNGFQAFRRDRTEDCSMCSTCSERIYCMGDSTHTWDFDRKEPRFCIKKILPHD